MPNISRCYWAKDEDGSEILIPICMGCAVNRPSGCTCDVPESRIESAERGRAEAERQITRLIGKASRRNDRQEAAHNWNRKLNNKINELESELDRLHGAQPLVTGFNEGFDTANKQAQQKPKAQPYTVARTK